MAGGCQDGFPRAPGKEICQSGKIRLPSQVPLGWNAGWKSEPTPSAASATAASIWHHKGEQSMSSSDLITDDGYQSLLGKISQVYATGQARAAQAVT